jgi:tetratricopeptide (TPR) repeat protein
MEKKMKHKDVIKLVKRNETQDFISGLKLLIKTHGEALIIAGIAAVIVLVGIPMILNGRAQNNAKAEQAVSEANYYLNRPVLDDPQAAMYGFFKSKKDKYEKAQGAFLNTLQTFKGTDSEPAATLGLANAYFGNGQFKEALEYYKTFSSKYPKHSLAAEALSGEAYAMYEMGQYGDAVKMWENVLKNYNGGNNPDDIRLRIADGYLKAGNVPAAKAICEEMIKGGRENFWTNAAKDMLNRAK